MAEYINYVEWDAKHRNYLIRLVGDEKSQEERLAKMLVAEEMYEALKELDVCYHTSAYSDTTRVNYAWDKVKQSLAKAEDKP
mgnify:CR=1 FL=1